jgi:hypothetical protein
LKKAQGQLYLNTLCLISELFSDDDDDDDDDDESG